MSDELDPVVFEVLAMVQGAIDALNTVKDTLASAAEECAQMAADFEASTVEASTAMEEMATKTEASAAKVRESQSGMSEGFKMMLEAAGAFSAYDFLKDSVKVAEDGQQAYAVLQQSIKNTGVAFNEEMAKSVESVDAQMRDLGYTNEQTNIGMSRMIQMTHNVAEAQNLMGLAANVAAARHMQLDAAVRMVGMAATGHVAMLGRLGIATKDAAGKTLTAKAAIDQLAQTFGGAASAQANTFAGKMAALKAQMDDTKEKVGNALIPILAKLLPMFANLVQTIAGMLIPALNTMATLWKNHSGLIKTVLIVLGSLWALTKVYSAAVAVQTGIMKTWAAVSALVTGATEAETGAQEALNTAMELNPIGLVVTAIAALIAIFVLAWNHCKTFRDIVMSAFHDIQVIVGNVVGFIIEMLKSLVDMFLHTIKSIIDGINDLDFTGTTDGARKAVDSFVDDTDKTLQGWADSAKKWGDQTKGAVVGATDAIKAARAEGAQPVNISGGYSNLVTNAPDLAAIKAAQKAAASAAKKSAEEAKKAWDEKHRQQAEAHKKLLAAEKKHQEDILKAQKQAAKDQQKAMADQIATLRAQLAAAQAALRADAQQNVQLVNGQLANVGTSALNLGYAQAVPQQNVTVHIAGSVVTQQQLVSGVQQGLLQTQRTNAGTGINR